MGAAELEQLLKMRLIQRRLALLQPVDFAFILIQAADVVPQVGEGGAGGEAHIAGPEHGYAHVVERSSLAVRVNA